MAQGSFEPSDAYYAAASSWADSQQDSLRRSRKIAWIIAGAATLIAMLQALALFFMLPLKTTVPHMLLVDKQTGYVQRLNPIEQQRISPDTALTHAFLAQYVLAREGFDIGTVQESYRKVSLWSANDVRSVYATSMQATNPASLLVRLPRTSKITARIRSVSAIDKDSALVRFETMRSDQNATSAPPQSWIATIDYGFSKAPMAVEDRYINPLGFEVRRYAKNLEAPPFEAAIPQTALPASQRPLP
jgi:type IV secretion system protein VirB8